MCKHLDLGAWAPVKIDEVILKGLSINVLSYIIIIIVNL